MVSGPLSHPAGTNERTMADEKDKPRPNQLNIEISEEVADGIYSNLAIITHSNSEFVVDFVRVMPGVPKAKVRSRILLTPQHAKRLMRAREGGLGPDVSTEPVQSKFEHTYLTQKIDAPENVRPTTGAPAAISLERLAASHAELQALLADADGQNLCAVMAKHQIFGDLDMYEWLIFLARHEQRHTAQLIRTATALKGEG